jgi:hypothetical protein
MSGLGVFSIAETKLLRLRPFDGRTKARSVAICC